MKLVKGYKALQEFINYAYARFGNPVRMWFKLDPQENMKLGERQFLRGCESINFTGNAAALWKYIDSDQSGSITILELHAPSAVMLAKFKEFIQPAGTSMEEAFCKLDGNQSMRIYKDEFVRRMRELEFEGPVNRLFELLDRNVRCFIALEDFYFFDKWQPPPYIFVEPSFEGLKRMKEVFIETKGNLLAAWRKALDRDGTMRISWDEWRHACSELLLKTGALGLPRTVDEVAAVWRAMDEDCSGWIAMREWDPESFAVVAEFKRWAERNHGGVVKAFKALDGSANCKLSEGELKKAARGPDGVKGDLELFFDGLRVNSSTWVLTENEVKFLDDWDLEWEDWEVSAAQPSEPASRSPGPHGRMLQQRALPPMELQRTTPVNRQSPDSSGDPSRPASVAA